MVNEWINKDQTWFYDNDRALRFTVKNNQLFAYYSYDNGKTWTDFTREAKEVFEKDLVDVGFLYV